MIGEQTALGAEAFGGYESEIQHECGVVGVWAPGEAVARMAYFMLHGVQHRGQQGAGIGIYYPEADTPQIFKGNGMIDVAIPMAIPGTDGTSLLDELTRSPVAVGHTRYATSGGKEGAQPFEGSKWKIAFVQNGHVQDTEELAEACGLDRSVARKAVTDSQLVTWAIDSRAEALGSTLKALEEVLPKIEGAYSGIVMEKDRLIGIRDPWGFHPLVLGKLESGNGYALASETVALDRIGAKFVRDIARGEIVVIDENGVSSEWIDRKVESQHCMFEHIYTASLRSIVDGSPTYVSRKLMGKYLAETHPVDADIVVGVPSSGLPFAAGYAEQSGIRLVQQGFDKDAYTPRTFIERGQRQQDMLNVKLWANPYEFNGMRVILTDDSVIKGNTMMSIVKMVREAGATEVHVVSGAPRFDAICMMGLDTGDVNKLIAPGRTDAEIAALIGADSISFNTTENVARAIDEARRQNGIEKPLGKLCTSCVTGEYALQSSTFRTIADRKVVELGMPSLALSRS